MFLSNCILSPGSILLAVSHPVRITSARSPLLLAECSKRIMALFYIWVISMCLRTVSGARNCTTIMVEAGNEQTGRTRGFTYSIEGILIASAASSLDASNATTQASETIFRRRCDGTRQRIVLVRVANYSSGEDSNLQTQSQRNLRIKSVGMHRERISI